MCAGWMLNVPYQSQWHRGHKERDTNGCWLASVIMLKAYFEQDIAGPKALLKGVRDQLGLTGPARDVWTGEIDEEAFEKILVRRRTTGRIEERHGPALLEAARLVELQYPEARAFTMQGLRSLLDRHGPIYFGWYTSYLSATAKSAGHASLLIGVDEPCSHLIFHDPDRGASKRMKLADFNRQFMWEERYNLLAQAPTG